MNKTVTKQQRERLINLLTRAQQLAIERTKIENAIIAIVGSEPETTTYIGDAIHGFKLVAYPNLSDEADALLTRVGVTVKD